MNKERETSPKYSREFSDRLRDLRNKNKISAREMSIALGQNVNYINLIENGKRFPSLQGFFAICDYLKITPSIFFDSENFFGWENWGLTNVILSDIIYEQ